MPRFYCPSLLARGDLLELPASAVRHVQVLRLQPGDNITLFNGGSSLQGVAGEFNATITRMGRGTVQVCVGERRLEEREARQAVHLALGMPANDRMDWLVEKATELGVSSIQPLLTERSVLRITGERAEKKVAHWQNVAIAACEQCGANQIPLIHDVLTFAAWMKAQASAPSGAALILSLQLGLPGLRSALATPGLSAGSVTFLSGPEGGFSSAEEESAVSSGFVPVSLGWRVLRAETAALTALAVLLVQ